MWWALDPKKCDALETFSLVAPSPHKIRWFFAFAHRRGYDIRRIDVKTVFLHSPINRQKYTFVPKGLQICGKTNLLKFKKAEYGLAISPLLRFTTFTIELRTLGFRQSAREPCLLYKNSGTTTTLILVYVDDVLLPENSLSKIEATISDLKTKFLVKELGFPETYEGFEVEKSEQGDALILHQRTYTCTFLDMFLPENQRGIWNTLINTFGNFSKSISNEVPLSASILYWSIIGMLYYYANGTRPDILFAVNYLSRVQSRPKNIHWILLQQVLQYIESTKDLALTFHSSESSICAYIDADFASDYTFSSTKLIHANMSDQWNPESVCKWDLQTEIYEKRKSTLGCLIQAYGNSVAWVCRKQLAITTSTTEAEFVAMAESLSLIIFLKEITMEISQQAMPLIEVYEDSISTATLLRLIFHHRKLKHLALQILRVKELIWKKEIEIVPVSTLHQISDILTKPLQTNAFLHLRPRLLRTKTWYNI